ncbi:MAG: bifunctional DNA primase/polymerase [Actinomycetota bacterium]
MRTRDAALAYALRGWAVLPCHEPASRGACSCGRADCTSPAKHPRTRRGLNEATTDPETVAAWWRRWPSANLALRTGAASGLVVIDVDPAHGGDASLARLVAEHGPLPRTLTVATGSGGRHYYFAHPGQPVRNSAGVLGPGLDVRGDGGYVVAPPSRHITGGTYQWANEAGPEALPAWLEQPPPRAAPARPQDARPPRQANAWASQAMLSELARVRHSEPGRRNNDLNRAAFALGQLVAAGHLDADLVHDLLVDAGLAVGLGGREVAATIRSGLEAGGRHPRHPAARSAPGEHPPAHAIDLRTIDLPGPRPAAPERGRDAANPFLP